MVVVVFVFILLTLIASRRRSEHLDRFDDLCSVVTIIDRYDFLIIVWDVGDREVGRRGVEGSFQRLMVDIRGIGLGSDDGLRLLVVVRGVWQARTAEAAVDVGVAGGVLH